MIFESKNSMSRVLYVSPTRSGTVVAVGIIFVVLPIGIVLYLAGLNGLGYLLANVISVGIWIFFTVPGFFILYFVFKPVVFDLNENVFWRGYAASGKLNSRQMSKIKHLKLEHLYSLGEINSSGECELALVMVGGERFLIAYYSSWRKAVGDAKRLSTVLGVPFLDRES